MITTHTVTYTSPLTPMPTVSHYSSADAAFDAAAAFILRGQYDAAYCIEDATDEATFRLRREVNAECWLCGYECPAPESNDEKPLCADCAEVDRLTVERDRLMAARRAERIPVELHNDTPFDRVLPGEHDMNGGRQ